MPCSCSECLCTVVSLVGMPIWMVWYLGILTAGYGLPLIGGVLLGMWTNTFCNIDCEVLLVESMEGFANTVATYSVISRGRWTYFVCVLLDLRRRDAASLWHVMDLSHPWLYSCSHMDRHCCKRTSKNLVVIICAEALVDLVCWFSPLFLLLRRSMSCSSLG